MHTVEAIEPGPAGFALAAIDFLFALAQLTRAGSGNSDPVLVSAVRRRPTGRGTKLASSRGAARKTVVSATPLPDISYLEHVAPLALPSKTVPELPLPDALRPTEGRWFGSPCRLVTVGVRHPCQALVD